MADPIMWFDFRSADLRGSFYEELLGWRSPRRPVTDRAILMPKVPRLEHRSFLTSSTTPGRFPTFRYRPRRHHAEGIFSPRPTHSRRPVPRNAYVSADERLINT